MAEVNWNDDVRDLKARIIVLETIQNHLLTAAARMSGAHEAFLQGLMGAAERSLHAVAGMAETADAKQGAADAIESFNDRSMRLIAALTPNTSKN